MVVARCGDQWCGGGVVSVVLLSSFEKLGTNP